MLNEKIDDDRKISINKSMNFSLNSKEDEDSQDPIEEKSTNLKTQKKSLGRKRKSCNDKGEHNKYSPDNMRKRFKNKCLNVLILFLNDAINKYFKPNEKYELVPYDENKNKSYTQNLLKKLSYKRMIYHIFKKNDNLHLLNESLKEIASNGISESFKLFEEEWNKKIIQKINEKKNVNKNLTIILNMTFRNFINVYLGKKELKDFGIVDDIKFEKVEEYFKYLKDKKHEKEYYCSKLKEIMYGYEEYYENNKREKARGTEINASVLNNINANLSNGNFYNPPNTNTFNHNLAGEDNHLRLGNLYRTEKTNNSEQYSWPEEKDSWIQSEEDRYFDRDSQPSPIPMSF